MGFLEGKDEQRNIYFVVYGELFPKTSVATWYFNLLIDEKAFHQQRVQFTSQSKCVWNTEDQRNVMFVNLSLY
jgi:hypothetical protein